MSVSTVLYQDLWVKASNLLNEHVLSLSFVTEFSSFGTMEVGVKQPLTVQ